MKIKQLFVLILALLLLICFSACGNGAANVDLNRVSIGESFDFSPAEGYLSYTIDKVQWSDNVTDFGIAPAELQSYDGVSYTDNGDFVSFAWPEYINEGTGQLAENLVFVLVDLTVTNKDALAKPIPEDNIMDDSWYTFRVDYISMCDISEHEKDSFRQYDTIWYDGTEDYAAASLGISGNNHYILYPGESLSYQLGFIIGSSDGDYSQFCITDGGGSFHAEGATYVPVSITGTN